MISRRRARRGFGRLRNVPEIQQFNRKIVECSRLKKALNLDPRDIRVEYSLNSVAKGWISKIGQKRVETEVNEEAAFALLWYTA